MSINTLPQGYTKTEEEKSGLYSNKAKLRLVLEVAIAFILLVALEMLLFPIKVLLSPPYTSLIIATLIIMVLHEALHYISFKASGLLPKLDFVKVPGYFWCPAVIPYGNYFTRQGYLTSLLLPQSLTILLIPWLLAPISDPLRLTIYTATIVNLLGGLADIKAALYLLKSHSSTTLYRTDSVLVTAVYNK